MDKRRGPGRPSTRSVPPLLERKGIVNSPKDSNNRLEFVYGDPTVFKSLFTYFKNIKAREIHLSLQSIVIAIPNQNIDVKYTTYITAIFLLLLTGLLIARLL